MTLNQDYPATPTDQAMTHLSIPAGFFDAVNAAVNAAAATSLDNTTNNVVAGLKERETYWSKRRDKFAARHALKSASTIERVKMCGTAVRPLGTVDVRLSDAGSAGYSGVGVCGSVWSCPVCSAKILAKRRDEVAQLLEYAAKQQKLHELDPDHDQITVSFTTMTLRHHAKQPLGLIWGGLSRCHRRLTQSKKVRELRKRLGFIGYVRVVELTHGFDNGWHPHIHQIALFRGHVSQAQLDELANAEFAVWERTAANEGLASPMREFFDAKIVDDLRKDLGDYLAKSTYEANTQAAWELASPHTKAGRGGRRTPWQILADIVDHNREEDIALWREYEQASKGKRLMTWSNGLKKLVGIGEVSDEEAAEEESGDGVEDTLVTLSHFQADLGNRPYHAAQLLNVAEAGHAVGGRALARSVVIDFCDRHSIRWIPADHWTAIGDRNLHALRREQQQAANQARAAAARVDAENAAVAAEQAEAVEVDRLQGELFAAATAHFDAVHAAKQARLRHPEQR